jgi:hypothetical protein
MAKAIIVVGEHREGDALQVGVLLSPRQVTHRTIALIWRPRSPFADRFSELAEVFRAALRRPRISPAW